MHQLHSGLVTLISGITALLLQASPAFSKPTTFYSAPQTDTWIDSNVEYLNGWEYQFSQQLLPPRRPAINYAPQVSGKQPTSTLFSYHPTFTTLSGDIANTNYFALNNTGPYNGFLNTTSGNMISTVWQSDNSSFFGQSASADLSSIAGFYSVIRPFPATLVAFYPYLAEKSGEKYNLVEAPLPDGVKNAGLHLRGNTFYLYETAYYWPADQDLRDYYSYRTLSVVNPKTRKIMISLDLGVYPFVLTEGHRVLLQGVSSKVKPDDVQDDITYLETLLMLSEVIDVKPRLSSDDFRKVEKIGATPVSVLCDLDSDQTNPCAQTPFITTSQQHIIGLNAKTGAYVLADGTVDPTCIYEVPFGKSTATPPNPGFTNCHAKSNINADSIASFKLSPDGELAIITEIMSSSSNSNESRLWLITGYEGNFPVDAVQFMESFPQLEELLKSYKNIIIDSIDYQDGIYILQGHNGAIAFKFQLRQKSTF